MTKPRTASVLALAAIAAGSTVAHADPVKHYELSHEHGCAANACKVVWCWGGEEFVYGGDKGVISTFTQARPYQVGAGDYHSCVNWRDVVDDPPDYSARGIIDCWGRNDHHQLDVPPEQEWRQLAVGPDHNCATNWSHHAICWGRDDSGQVSGTPGVQLFALLSAGATQSCGTSRRPSGTGFVDGEGITCWGKTAGAIQNVPASVLPDAPSERFVEVSAGLAHTCALSNRNQVYCWGEDGAGQLVPDLYGIPEGYEIALEGGDTISHVTLSDFVDVSAGDYATCAAYHNPGATPGGGVHCWGYPFSYDASLWTLNSDPASPLPAEELPLPIGFRPDSVQLTYNEVCALGYFENQFGNQIGDSVMVCYAVNYPSAWSCDPNVDPSCIVWELEPDPDPEGC